MEYTEQELMEYIEQEWISNLNLIYEYVDEYFNNVEPASLSSNDQYVSEQEMKDLVDDIKSYISQALEEFKVEVPPLDDYTEDIKTMAEGKLAELGLEKISDLNFIYEYVDEYFNNVNPASLSYDDQCVSEQEIDDLVDDIKSYISQSLEKFKIEVPPLDEYTEDIKTMAAGKLAELGIEPAPIEDELAYTGR